MRKLLFFLGTLFSIVQVEGKGAVDLSHPINVIIDTDASIDDMMAILYLVKTPRIDVKAIITVGGGMTHIETGGKNISDLLELAGRSNIPVAYGSRRSQSPAGSYPPEWKEEENNVGGIKLPKNPVEPVRERGVDYMVEQIMKNPLKTTLLCLGPLTNIAIALEKAPQIKDHIERVYILGGAILSPGNIGGRSQGFRNQVAEYNIFLDAKAANTVFTSDIPITLVPIDVAEHVPVSKEFFEKLAANRKTPSANFVYEVIKPYTRISGRDRSFFWDPLAAVLVAYPELATYRNLKLTVNLKKGPEYGRLMMTKVGANTQVATGIDAKAFYETFLESLNRPVNFKQSRNESK